MTSSHRSPPASELEQQIAEINARLAGIETARGYIETAIAELRDDARWLRRTWLTAIIGTAFAASLTLLGAILHALGKS